MSNRDPYSDSNRDPYSDSQAVPGRHDGGPRRDAFASLRPEAAYLLRFSCIVFSANLLDREDAHERAGIGVDGRVACRSLNH